MIKSRINIGGFGVLDFESAYGFVQISSDNTLSAPTKAFEKSSYPEQSGINILPKTVDDAFEYKATFFIKAEGNLETANLRIAKFNKAISDVTNGVRNVRQIEFYNDYKRVKIVGYPKPIQSVTEFWRDSSGRLHDVVCVELVINVTDPSLCDFNLDGDPYVDYEVFYVRSEALNVKKPKE